MAAPEPNHEFTLPQVEYKISETLRLLSSSAQLDPHRPARLRRLAQLHSMRNTILQQRQILDTFITRLTKLVLFPFQPGKEVASGFFHLAYNLNVRFSRYEQPEDLKSSLKYCRYLRDNFHSLDAFDISRDQFTSLLIQVLADNLKFGSGDIMPDMEEMVALIPEVLSSESDVLTHESRDAITAFIAAVNKTEIFRRRDTQQVADRVVRMLREATALKQDLQVSLALACCLDARFQTTHVIDDYEEAIAIADKIVAAITPEDVQTQDGVVGLIVDLVAARLNSYVTPEYLEDSIHRLRVLLRLPSLPDEDSTHIAGLLNIYVWQRSHYFGVTGDSRGIPLKNADVWRPFLLPVSETSRQQHGKSDNNSGYRTLENSELLNKILFAICNEEITDVDVAVERARTLLPPPNSNLLFSWFPAIADKFAAINRRLESVTMSVAQSESDEMGNSETETGDREGMDPIGSLVTTKRKLIDERNFLISHIQSLPGLKNFLRQPSFDALNSAAARGLVVIINHSEWRSDIVILHKDSPPSVISTPSDFYARANGLKDRLLRVRKEKGLESEDYGHNLASVLADLYKLVGKPDIERFRQLKIPEKSRVWWCPTSAFCSLPLHAMGPIPSGDSDGLYFMDLYISSYTPTLSALIESRKSRSQPITHEKPSLLLVAQPETLHGAWGEIDAVQAVGSSVTTLVSATATPETVVEGLKVHRFAHFVCHGLLEIGKPFDASFELHGDNLTLLEIVRSQLPTAEFAFLSACHTAELTEDSIADEGLHLAAAMQFCGFRSVIGTMWAMADTDGADLSKHFYKSIFSESTGRRGMPYYERSARALQFAVKKLRKKRGITLERWVNFVHYGA